DYVTLLKSSTVGRDLVRAYAYTGLDPENENQRNFHSFLSRHGYKVVSKDIRKYGDGKVKANLDIELVVDMMKTARNLDVAIVVSGDGDFAPAIRAVQEMGVRVEVISFRGNTSSDLIEVADLFTDITQLARVDKTSSRSGRRVAGDDEDLSMTEVPDKQTEGTGQRGRGRGRDGEALPAGEAATTGTPVFDEDEGEEEDVAPTPRGPRTTPFGSVWDSQLGTPTSAPASLGPVTDDEDFDEPEIPEYLIAEQRRGRQGPGQGGPGGRGGQGRGGPRGGRSAYSSAIDRERYGRGGGG